MWIDQSEMLRKQACSKSVRWRSPKDEVASSILDYRHAMPPAQAREWEKNGSN